MQNSTLLVVVSQSTKPAALEPLSETARENNVHLIVVILGVMPPIPVYTYAIGEYGAYVLPDSWYADVERANAALDKLRKQVSQYLADQGASAEVRVVSGDAAAIPDALTRHALTCDGIVIGDDLRAQTQLFNGVLREMLYHAPAGVMLNAQKSTSALQPKSVFVAWKAGGPAARAVRAALPLLRTASAVTVALFDPGTEPWEEGETPGSDVAAWLSQQGCKVTVQPYPSGGEEIGKVMLKRARETAADLIVMGAYDHSRLREIVFGGTTQTMIEQQDFAVLMCH